MCPRSGVFQLLADRARDAVDAHFSVALIDNKSDDRGKMSVSRENNEGVDIAASHRLLIDIIQHDKIREILFVMLAGIFRIKDHRRGITDAVQSG